MEIIKTFNNVAELKKYNHTVDTYVSTLGYYDKNDNGGATYKIITLSEYKNSQPDDIKSVVTVADEYGSFTVNDNLIKGKLIL